MVKKQKYVGSQKQNRVFNQFVKSVMNGNSDKIFALDVNFLASTKLSNVLLKMPLLIFLQRIYAKNINCFDRVKKV
jgi:hypothetical protein